MTITSELPLDSLADAKCWVLDQVSSLNIENIARLLDLVPCPFAYGSIICKINPRCHARVDRRVKTIEEVHYYCFYDDIPVVSEEVIIPVTAGLIALYLPESELIDKLARLLLVKNHDKKEKVFAEMFMFSSTYLGQLIVKKDTCLPCMYRSEVKKQIQRQRSRRVSETKKVATKEKTIPVAGKTKKSSARKVREKKESEITAIRGKKAARKKNTRRKKAKKSSHP